MSRNSIYIAEDDSETWEKFKSIFIYLKSIGISPNLSSAVRWAVANSKIPQQEKTSEVAPSPAPSSSKEVAGGPQSTQG
jgi:hypothetical protein